MNRPLLSPAAATTEKTKRHRMSEMKTVFLMFFSLKLSNNIVTEKPDNNNGRAAS
jgi:hypothetical protein